MHISRNDLDSAVAKGIISSEQAQALWEGLDSRDQDSPSFNLTHVIYYFGTLIVIAAMGWLVNLGWERLGGGGITLVAFSYALIFASIGYYFWFIKRAEILGGLFFTIAVCMTPLTVYGLEKWLGLWSNSYPDVYQNLYSSVSANWVWMEVGTIIVALITLYFIRFPFLTAPLAFALWFLSMDIVPLIVGDQPLTDHDRMWSSLIIGLGMLIVSFSIDQRTKKDFAFWGYLFGLLAFWFGLFILIDTTELNKFIYFVINCGLIVLSVILDRKIFIVLGGIGAFGYLGYLAYDKFADSLIFPFILSLAGLGVIYLGMLYQRNYTKIQSFVLRLIPNRLKDYLPSERIKK